MNEEGSYDRIALSPRIIIFWFELITDLAASTWHISGSCAVMTQHLYGKRNLVHVENTFSVRQNDILASFGVNNLLFTMVRDWFWHFSKAINLCVIFIPACFYVYFRWSLPNWQPSEYINPFTPSSLYRQSHVDSRRDDGHYKEIMLFRCPCWHVLHNEKYVRPFSAERCDISNVCHIKLLYKHWL